MDSSATFSARIDALFAGQGVKSVQRAIEPGHAGMERDASLMEHPRLIVCLEGAVDFQHKEGVARLVPGDGLFVGPGRWVRARIRQPYVSMGVVFYANATRFYLMRGKPAREWRAGGPAETCVVPAGIGEEARALGRLLAEPPPGLAPEKFLHHAFECLLIAARELLRTPAPVAAGGGKARFTWQAACDYVTENLQRPVSRKDVARHLVVHPNHLSRLFAEFSREPFSRYLQNRRLERARLLLEDPRLNIAEVARLSGFASANYFIRVFRQHTGRTPTRVRRAGK